MLRDPVVADTVRVLEAMRTGRSGGSMDRTFAEGGSTAIAPAGSASSGLGLGLSNELGIAILQELQQNRSVLEKYANRPIQNNYRLFEQFEDDVQQVRTESGI